MISVAEAKEIVFSNTYEPKSLEVNIKKAAGEVLWEPIYADQDFPPFDRVMMDGIAIKYESYLKGQRQFNIESVQSAGKAAGMLKNVKGCIEIMTGAVLPKEADTIIRYEDFEINEQGGNKVAILNDHISVVEGQNVHKKGMDRKAGDILIETGTVISPAEVGTAAFVGKSTLKVVEKPTIAIISSGDELVEIDEVPKPHQIRKSNSYTLFAALKEINIEAEMFHLPDDKVSMLKQLSAILNSFDVLVLSGGVSKGKFDYVPAVMEELGVKKLFHKVRQRPGKPFWFGKTDSNKFVFALPGNPVSTFICFYNYVKPWLIKSLKSGNRQTQFKAVLTKDMDFEPNLTYFLQVRVSYGPAAEILAYPKQGKGSGDFANLLYGDGFLELPENKKKFKAGEVLNLIPYRNPNL